MVSKMTIINMTDQNVPAINAEELKTSPERFFNRELSWLAFNRRVLEEANNKRHPLLERVRFLSISARNMDEFYMVRVAGLKTQVKEGFQEKSIDGNLPSEQLEDIQERALSLVMEEQNIWSTLKGELEKEGILIEQMGKMSKEDKAFLSQYFEESVFPVLTPLAVDPAHPFPFLPNKARVFALRLINRETGERLEAVLPVPESLSRFIRLPKKGKKIRYCRVEDLILHNLDQLFPPYDLEDSAFFKIIRDSEIEVEDEADDLVENFETALKRRRRGNVIFLMINRDISDQLMHFITSNLSISESEVCEVNGFIALTDLAELITDDCGKLQFSPYASRFPERIKDFNGDYFAAIKAKDIIVHHPYETFDVVVQFIRQAAHDPNVVAIKQTLYRTSKDSPIVKALIEAAENGKSVTVLVELKARFDEEANIRWARDLERVGAQVVFGFVDYKTHAKLSLVTRKEHDKKDQEKVVQYAHFGTGNYHPGNAEIYTDLSFFTCNPEYTSDSAKIFNFLTGYATPKDLEKVFIAPLTMRQQFYKLIDKEISHAKAGKYAEIMAKMNALVDKDMIDKLYEASQAGVKIRLVVRGICALRPGIEGLSENIIVTSIVGRFLEHARIYCFANGEPFYSPKNKVYMASADWMTRNLDHRVEALIPIENETVHEQVCDQIMIANICDNKQSWKLRSDGTYERVVPDGKEFGTHEYFMINPSLSGRGSSLSKKAKKRKKKFRPLLFPHSDQNSYED